MGRERDVFCGLKNPLKQALSEFNLAAQHWTAAHSPLSFPQQDGVQKQSKGETRGLR